MSTPDRQEQGPLTRKQLREIRLTGATPVITPEEAAAAAAAAPPEVVEPVAEEPAVEAPAVQAPAVEEPAVQAPAVEESASVAAPGSWAQTPLTRRQVRERERGNTAPTAIPVAAPDAASDDAGLPAQDAEVDSAQDVAPEPARSEVAGGSEVVEAAPVDDDIDDEIDDDDIDDADEVDAHLGATPVSASASVDNAGEVPLVLEQVDPAEVHHDAAGDPELTEDREAGEAIDADASERATVNSAFGRGVLQDAEAAPQPFTPSFDELLTANDSTGSQHLAPNTLIFNPSAGDGSLSGPVASTGEILVTGSYELPKGLGSQGHAHGTTDGKDVDAVLIDGELPPASSPTPIAASSAVSTIKPAGEVIRPPAPEKGNKLTLILAIVTGGLALALGVALIVAFTSNVF